MEVFSKTSQELPELSERLLRLDDFDFEVLPHLVAQEPALEREKARLLLRRLDGSLRHGHVAELADFIPPDALVIVNDTQVFASRLRGKLASGGAVELFLLGKPQGLEQAEALALGRPLRKLRPGVRVQLAGGIEARIVVEEGGAPTPGAVRVAFNCGAAELASWLDREGYIPLPPYIRRPEARPAADSADRERYQTVYARERGSVAAPTAGLHFTPRLLADLAQRGVRVLPITLHVGAGTFLPVKNSDLAEHPMHAEGFLIPRPTLAALLEAKKEGRPVVVVGTTSLRCLEAAYGELAGGRVTDLYELADRWLETRLFIYPRQASERYKVWSADILMTNFHQPCSTLFMLVCALIGYKEAMILYRQAMALDYRLFSYGDASLLELTPLS